MARTQAHVRGHYRNGQPVRSYSQGRQAGAAERYRNAGAGLGLTAIGVLTKVLELTGAVLTLLSVMVAVIAGLMIQKQHRQRTGRRKQHRIRRMAKRAATRMWRGRPGPGRTRVRRAPDGWQKRDGLGPWSGIGPWSSDPGWKNDRTGVWQRDRNNPSMWRKVG